MQSFCVEISHHHYKNLSTCLQESLSISNEKTATENKNLLLIGDFNIDSTIKKRTSRLNFDSILPRACIITIANYNKSNQLIDNIITDSAVMAEPSVRMFEPSVKTDHLALLVLREFKRKNVP